MAFNYFYGAYSNVGPYNNVAVGGSPDSTGPMGAPLDNAHDNGYGYGIEFTNDGYRVRADLNLVAFSVNASGQFVPNLSYVVFGGHYQYLLEIEVSSDGGHNYTSVFNEKILSHPDTYTLCYKDGWKTTAEASQWVGEFDVPEDTTHVRIELYGEIATMRHYNVYPIDVVITPPDPDPEPEPEPEPETFRPWACRKNESFVSCNNPGGFTMIRQGGSFTDIPEMVETQVGEENEGSSRIRKDGVWLGQDKFN